MAIKPETTDYGWTTRRASGDRTLRSTSGNSRVLNSNVR